MSDWPPSLVASLRLCPQAPSSLLAADVPHIDECAYCQRCLVDGAPAAAAGAKARRLHHLSSRAQLSPYTHLRQPAALQELASLRLLQLRKLQQEEQQAKDEDNEKEQQGRVARELPDDGFEGQQDPAAPTGGTGQGAQEGVGPDGGAGVDAADEGEVGPAWQQWPPSIQRILAGSELGPHGSVAPMLGPSDEAERAALPNCTVCRGCNAELEEIGAQGVCTCVCGGGGAWVCFLERGGVVRQLSLSRSVFALRSCALPSPASRCTEQCAS